MYYRKTENIMTKVMLFNALLLFKNYHNLDEICKEVANEIAFVVKSL